MSEIDPFLVFTVRYLHETKRKHIKIKLSDCVIIIVVIITWPSEKLHKKNNSDITVVRACDSFKWVMFMQNFELDVTVFNQLKNIICGLLFFVCCFQ